MTPGLSNRENDPTEGSRQSPLYPFKRDLGVVQDALGGKKDAQLQECPVGCVGRKLPILKAQLTQASSKTRVGPSERVASEGECVCWLVEAGRK